MSKLAQRQMLVTIEGIPGRWATKSGGNTSADTTPVWDGGAENPEILASPRSTENVSVTRPFDDLRDLSEIARLRRLVGRFTGTITCQPTDADLFPIGEPTVYPDALLVTLTEPEYDSASGDPQIIGLEFAAPQVV